MHLECDKCTVREWRSSDRESIVEHGNNRKIWRNLGARFPHPYTVADADQWFEFLGKFTEPTHWAIEVAGQSVGGIGVDPGEGEYEKSGRFGYWLGEAFWGQGIMSAAVEATSEYVMSEFDLVRLESPVFAWNPASMRVLEKCGFVREGILKRSIFKDGEIIDSVLYAKVH